MESKTILVFASALVISSWQGKCIDDKVSILTRGHLKNGDDDMTVCWRDSYGRGAGSIPNHCDDGYEMDAGLCYQECKENYSGVGPLCWKNCPPGYIDHGALCGIPPDTYYECPWYDVCGLIFDKGCLQPCKDGYEMVLCSCYRPAVAIPKDTYGRGVGRVPSCSENLSGSGGLCYENCKDGFVGSGPVCWQNGSGNANYTIQCDPFAYGHTQEDCDELKHFLKEAGFNSMLCIAALAATIAEGHPVGPEICIKLVTQILPTLAKTRICES